MIVTALFLVYLGVVAVLTWVLTGQVMVALRDRSMFFEHVRKLRQAGFSDDEAERIASFILTLPKLTPAGWVEVSK